MTTLMSR